MKKTVNIFEDAFCKQEIDKLRVPEFSSEAVSVKYTELVGRCDDFLNKNFRAGSLTCPVFQIDGKTWMSLTPMEIQSNYLPIQRAAGNIATAGLGIGYFAIRAAQKPEVTHVDVYERNPAVIEFFTKAYEGRPELAKIHIHQGDARQLLVEQTKPPLGKPYDFLYIDIYPTLLGDEVIEDQMLFMLDNRCAASCSFWGQELAILEAVAQQLQPDIEADESAFFAMWFDAKTSSGHRISDMFQSRLDSAFVERFLENRCDISRLAQAEKAKRLTSIPGVPGRKPIKL